MLKILLKRFVKDVSIIDNPVIDRRLHGYVSWGKQINHRSVMILNYKFSDSYVYIKAPGAEVIYL